MVHAISNAFVVSLNDPVAIPPIFKEDIAEFELIQDQPLLVTPANSDRRSAVMIEPAVCAVGAGRFSAPPLLLKIENVRCEIVIGSKMFGGG